MGDHGVDLIRRIQHGDEAALAELMAEHSGLLRVHLVRYVGPADAEDMLQEVWLRVWERAGQWEGRGRPLAWLLAIATNLALNHLRSRRNVVPLEALPGDEVPDVATLGCDAVVPGPEEQVLWRERLGRVREAMAQLPPDKQEALRLVRVQGYRLEEAARLLGIPLGTLKSRLHHAHRLLMEHLEDEHERD
ncbi:MAG TPA: RNA polymerase sigma factor [Armatimonadota bacterium]|nr:RNA polymerase sigma factor [Armatimonadota bacterium]